MSIKAIGSSWKSQLRNGTIANRDLRLYADFRQKEYPDLGTGSAQYTFAREDNLIDRGNCEFPIAPMVFGEKNKYTSNSTWVRSSDWYNTGRYSYKFTKTNAAGGSTPFINLMDNVSAGDMHGFRTGQVVHFSAWVRMPTLSGALGTEMFVVVRDINGSAVQNNTQVNGTNTYDEWQHFECEHTISDDAQTFYILIGLTATAAINEYFYVDDIRVTSHTIPGSHYLSDGYIETLCPLTETGTIQIGFIPRFAYDVATSQEIIGWFVSSTQEFRIAYGAGADAFTVIWEDGGTARSISSAQYDDGTTYRNINQKIILTFAYDLSTGSTAGSSLWLNKTQDDTTWSGNIDALSTQFNKQQIRANNANVGAFDILFVRQFPNFVATNADVQNDFKDVGVEEIYWSLDGHGTGKTRVNINTTSDKRFEKYDSYKGITGKLINTFGTNTLNVQLNNDDGRFSDDQNAAWDPASAVYNGTDEQNYLQQRFGVMLEDWFDGDFDNLFVGRATEEGFRRQSKMPIRSTVNVSAEDLIGDLDRSYEEYGRILNGNMLCREDTLIDRGGCQSLTSPMIFGETVPVESNADWDRTDEDIYSGRYAYKFTKTIAAGTAAYIQLTDDSSSTNLHGLVAGATYQVKIKIKIPSGGMVNTEIQIFFQYYDGGWVGAAANPTATYDAWQEITIDRTFTSGATGAFLRINVTSTAALNEYFYVGMVELIPANKAEATDNSLFHLIAKRGWRRQIQYLSNNSFENTTIGNSWLVTTGGTLNKDAADGLFGSASGELIPGASTEAVYQDVLFTGVKKLNVGESYNFSVFVKSTAAASGVNNFIRIQESDSIGANATVTVFYTLAGGEGYKKYDVSITISDPQSDRIRILVFADAGDTINIDGAMLIQSDSALNYFDVNALDGASGESLADLGQEIVWPFFGIHTGNVDYIHPWRRLEINSTVWQNLKSVGAGTGARYCGADENGTLINYAILDNGFGDSVPAANITGDFDDIDHVMHDGLLIKLDQIQGNRLYGVGYKYEVGTVERLIWLASATGNFTEKDGEQQLEEIVAVNGYWPDPNTYAEYWAEYGTSPDFAINKELTIVPFSISYRELHGTDRATFTPQIMVKNPFQMSKVPASKRDRIIGIQDAILIHKTVGSTDDGALSYVTYGRVVSGLDIQSRAGQARILLQNATASSVTLIDAAIVGKAVYRFGDGEGFIHDSYIDRNDIQKNGERLIQFGGEDVINGEPGGQLDRLADFIWKDRSTRKHIYIKSFHGALHDLSPADWIQLNVGSAGETENIVGTAEILGVRIDVTPQSKGITQITSRELVEGWKPDSNANARFFARGVTVNKTSTGAVVTVGSEYYVGDTDFRVPKGNTAAEVYINEAIDFLSNIYGGGTVLLTEGTFIIDGTINLKDGITLAGKGDRTIIDGDALTASESGIWAKGTVGSWLTNVNVRDFKMDMNFSGLNAISFTYVQFGSIQNIYVTASQQASVSVATSDGITINNIQTLGISQYFLYLAQTDNVNVSNCVGDGNGTGSRGLYVQQSTGNFSNIVIKNFENASQFVGVYLNITNYCNFSNIKILDCLVKLLSGKYAYGIWIAAGTNNTFTTCVIDNIDNTYAGEAANSYGVLIDDDDNCFSNILTSNCSGTGILINTTADRTQIAASRSTNNGTNFTDNGTDSTYSVEDT